MLLNPKTPKAMKYTSISFVILLTVAALMLAVSCKDEGFPVPEASTQADFSFTSTKEEDNTAPFGFRFKVELTNKSLNATSYLWDFGNGETSTEENPTVYYYQSGQYTITLTVGSSKVLHYNRLTKSVTLTAILDAVPLPFSENFDNTDTIPDIFTVLDVDGDGLSWYWGSRQGNGQARSQSYNSATGEALIPDNYLITPKLDLTTIPAGKQIIVRYGVCPTANTPIYRQEHYGVFVSTTGKAAADFTNLIFEETLTTDNTNWVYQYRELDISHFAGQYIYVAFRHYNVTDMDRIVLDDIEIFVRD
ncbi:MAG: choice-of-anchor J domain-containing protein [Bacteroidetes bacterium]|nr:choice-of-anchor J domain-containing protein [Bacteroidota bacterium]